MDIEPEPELKLPLDLRCPTCGAGPGEGCTLALGDKRSAPHRDRRVIANDLTKTPTVATHQRNDRAPKNPGAARLGNQPNCERY